MYSAGAVANARLAPAVYPGWTCRFYVGGAVDRDDRAELLTLPHVEVVDMDEAGWAGLFWRFFTVREPGIEVHLFRDADSRLCAREAAAVDEWLSSGKRFHIMRDHPAHWIEMLAATWGCTALGAAEVRDLLPDPLWNTVPYVDQWWLTEAVYPVARRSVFVHDPAGRIDGEEHHPFPVDRDPAWSFVAQGFNADGSLRIPADALAPVSREEVLCRSATR